MLLTKQQLLSIETRGPSIILYDLGIYIFNYIVRPKMLEGKLISREFKNKSTNFFLQKLLLVTLRSIVLVNCKHLICKCHFKYKVQYTKTTKISQLYCTCISPSPFLNAIDVKLQVPLYI